MKLDLRLKEFVFSVRSEHVAVPVPVVLRVLRRPVREEVDAERLCSVDAQLLKD